MLGWALKKGFQGATGLRDAPQGGEDTTQFDAPDTPAPVFAARAIKNAIWGQSTAAEAPPSKIKPDDNERVANPVPGAATTSQSNLPDTRSPTKLNSILLTPGTATSRRKRVSFGRDVKAANTISSNTLASSSNQDVGLRKKTTLQQALENSRPAKTELQAKQPEQDDTDEDWEWEDEDVCCHHEVTVDLNEPHSESGKYWKAEWTRYREEAKSDIEQLVKYKANAKSFAAKKDMEASRLSQQLKEEQAKVAEMEKKVADMTTKLAVIRKHGSDKDNASMTKDLATQAALVAEYREQIKDLENRLKAANRRAIDTSPQPEQSIYEVSRELRKARSELRQLDRLRDEVKRLKSALATSRERVAELEAQASTGETVESSRVVRLEKQLREVKEESRQKDMEIRKLKRDYESLKRDAKSRTAEAMQVLQDKNIKIDELEKKLKEMETTSSLGRSKGLDAAIAAQNKTTRDLKSGIESLGKPSRYEKARHRRAASVEDISLDMTQRSLLRGGVGHGLGDIRQEKAYGGDLLTDWTADIPTFELQVKDTGKGREETEKLDEKPIMEAIDTLPSRRAARSVGQQSLYGNHRPISDVLSDRVNESSRRQARRQRQAETNDPSSINRTENNTSQRTASTRTTSLAEDRAATRDALGQPTRRSRALSRITRPTSPDNEAPTIDLLQDQFSRLGGPSADRSAIGNASRCTLPAERQAAARARLEQKRIERRKTSRLVLDKENVRP
ncbi:hypothetical protein O1611_g868 [Lasiodiplodia mahajangana]|uniref:Uncharacterized protein n=1 Tax=Lasiodiplodia mahajangana TaxID=1108764 RepID=A0ACC2JZH2_9PEZI|nr:hypothetical protein O1611_g868 [Lasiodiplodia mahajangana]